MIAPALLAVAILLAPAILLAHGTGGRAPYLRGSFHAASMAGFTLAGWLLVRGGGIWERLAFVVFGLCWTGPFWIVALHSRHAAGVASSPAVEAADEADEIPPEEPLEPHGRLFFERLLAISRRRVGELVTPREKIVYADCVDGVAGALTKIRNSGFLRMPMVDGNLDRIVGVLHAKDLAPLVLSGRPMPPLRSVMRRAFFISRDATFANLLELFRAQRGHLAVVVDEYNRTVGLVTRSDFFRHLAGGGQEKP